MRCIWRDAWTSLRVSRDPRSVVSSCRDPASLHAWDCPSLGCPQGGNTYRGWLSLPGRGWPPRLRRQSFVHVLYLSSGLRGGSEVPVNINHGHPSYQRSKQDLSSLAGAPAAHPRGLDVPHTTARHCPWLILGCLVSKVGCLTHAPQASPAPW